MFSKLRPLLFKIDPEKAHNLAIKSLKFNINDYYIVKIILNPNNEKNTNFSFNYIIYPPFWSR